MYLVIARCNFDDIPLRLFAEWDAAIQYAMALDYDHPDLVEASAVMESCSDACGVDVVEFNDGKPVGRSRLVRNE